MVDGRPACTNTLPRYKNSNIGDYTYGEPVLLYWDNRCSVGKFCAIAPLVLLFGGGEHYTDMVSTYPFHAFRDLFPAGEQVKPQARTKGPTVVGNDVWIGTEAVVLSGVNVGDGAVIGARSVVTSNVPPYAIVGGNPARILRYRFSAEVTEELLAIRWWDFPADMIDVLVPLLQSPRVDLFLRAARLCRQELDSRQPIGSGE